MSTPRFEMSPTSRFGDRASDYALFRPSYPAAAIDAVIQGLPEASRLVAADIGAGTGIASRLLAERGVRVLAVEPNPGMRESAEPHPLVSFHDGAAETTGLTEGSVDLVLCAQAFHWFKPQEALSEFRRILRRPGRLALLVNERADDDAAMRAYNTAIRAAALRELSEGMRGAVDDALLAGGLFTAPVWFPHRQTLSREGLVGRARSASYVPKEGPRYEQLLLDLERLWEDHHDASGQVSLGYRTYVWRVDLGASPE